MKSPVAFSRLPLEKRRETIVRRATAAERRGRPSSSPRGGRTTSPCSWARQRCYPRPISRLGFAKEAEAVINITRGSAVVPPDAEVLLDELTVCGTPDQARARIAG